VGLCYYVVVRENTMLNEKDQTNLGLILKALACFALIGLMVRWALTSWIGFIVVALIVILLATSGNGPGSYSHDYGFSNGYYH